jgi:colanic acid/amylovoran biosynthesis glycosyltransferase
MSKNPMLKIVSVLRAGQAPGRRLVVTRKFVEGLVAYRRSWTGEMAVYMPPGASATGNLDDVVLDPDEFPCEVKVIGPEHFAREVSTDRDAVILLSLDDFHQSSLSSVCARNGIPSVYVSEYSIKTRLQIVDATARNPVRRIRRKMWESGLEERRRKALTIASGLQANGTPTFDDYQSIKPDALLFFDTRVGESMVASEEQVQAKFGSEINAQPLRLLFSGRFTAMKGVMDLIEVARELKKLRVNFTLTLCGDGELRGALEKSIQTYGLSDCVTLTGVLNFTTELIPLVKGSVDLFLCCHPQGDPACTYLETMACGVPIAGYDNDAFAGVVRHSGAGWVVPMHRPERLAAEIHRLANQRGELLAASLKALRFARQHTFEKTFERRVEHLRAVAENVFANRTGHSQEAVS